MERKLVYQKTSGDAWKSFLPASPTLDDMILAVLKSAGEDGLICEDIEQTINRSHQSVSGNLRHLVEKNFVEATGTKGITKSNRSAMKWKLREI